MHDPFEARPEHGTRATARHARFWPLAALLVLAPQHAAARPEASPGLLLRQARHAAAAGRTAAARIALEELRSREPSSARGFEATLLLADIELSDGNEVAADAVLASAARVFADGAASARVALARGWLALATHRYDDAAAELAKVPQLEPKGLSADIAELGGAWSRLLAGRASDAATRFGRLARHAADPAIRVAAAMSLARAEATAGRVARALHALRGLRRTVRATRLGDDVELAIGLVQLDSGNPRSARRTFERLARSLPSAAPTDAATDSPPPPPEDGLTLSDLRSTPVAFARRVTGLYTARSDRTAGLIDFLAQLFDRDAVADVPEALRLTGAPAPGKEA